MGSAHRPKLCYVGSDYTALVYDCSITGSRASLPLERNGGRLHMIQMLIYENNTAPDTVDPKAHQPNYIVGARWGAITYDTSVDT
jgi:hypothetical protein